MPGDVDSEIRMEQEKLSDIRVSTEKLSAAREQADVCSDATVEERDV